ncbi:hypothetical protein J5N97_018739 [Dioscorea zingiberensis]|uniref:NERD domain-containing protein n=1 Tax=Dioscorea zingiberensis TaxID=325984 RepID=A0A9D5CEI9_9LILI|nr:hypothetical protein J5N97_018739 [Dioscorea zingiberensis]
MWFEIVFGLVIYKLFTRFIYGDNSVPDLPSDSGLFFTVASRIEKIYGGKSYVGLRIPDPETSTRQHIDIVLVTKKEVMVIAVRNIQGFVEVGKDGEWVCVGDNKHKTETFSDPVLEVRRQAEVLEQYLEQRGLTLPKGGVVGKVLLPNANCRLAYKIASQPEIISFDDWNDLKPEFKSKFSGWIKDAFHGGKSDPQDGFYEKLHFILSTAPMWDRLELKGDRFILGEFMEFKGNQDDMQALRNVKRSKVSKFIIQSATMLGLGRSRVQILYAPRDYRIEGMSASDWKEVAVKPSTEVLFQPLNSKKPKKLKITSIVSVCLSA